MKLLSGTFFIYLVFSFSICNAQSLNFEKLISPENDGISFYSCSKIDLDGNLIFAGAFSGTVDFDPGPGITSLTSNAGTQGQFFLSKYNPDGNLIWAIPFGSTQYGAQYFTDNLRFDFDSNGDIIVGAAYKGSGDMNPSGSITDTLKYTNTVNLFYAKFSTNGDLLWHKESTNPSTQECSVRQLIVNDQDEILVTGIFNGNFDFDPGSDTLLLTSTNTNNDIFLLKMSNSGDLNWAFKLGGNQDDFTYDLKFIQNDVLLLGSFSGLVDFNPGPSLDTIHSRSIQSCAFVARYDGNGNYLWAKKIGNKYGATASSFDLTSKKSIVIGGVYYDTLDMDPGPGVYYPEHGVGVGGDLFVLQLDSNGLFEWGKGMGSQLYDAIHQLKLLDDDRILIAGHYSDTFSVKINSTQTSFQKYGTYNNFAMLLDSTNIQLGQTMIYNADNEFTSYHGYADLLVSNDGSVYMNGSLNDSAYVFGNSGNDTILVANADYRAFSMKYHLSDLGIETKYEGSKSYIVYPNPTSSQIVIESSLVDVQTSIQVMDVNGKIIDPVILKSKNKAQLILSPFEAGVYFVNLVNGENHRTIRVVKVN